jgi:hypothetical protein
MVPAARDLLATWEQGQHRHPLDRALLLYALADPNAAPAGLADRPLGQRNMALLRLHRAMFGRRLRAALDCPDCVCELEIELDVDGLCGAAEVPPAEVELTGRRFRVPTTRDLAAIAHQSDVDTAAEQLVQLCRIVDPDREGTTASLPRVEELEAAWEDADPNADIALDLACSDCGHRWHAEFDVPAFVWTELASYAVRLLDEVHLLAGAYGWNESEILALSDVRRAAYIERAIA